VALKDYRIPERVIELSDGVTFAVRGLSLPQVTHILTKYGEQVRNLFVKYQANVEASNLSLTDMEAIGNTVLLTSPDLAAEIIAVAAGEEDAIDVIKALPFPAQIAALEAVADLTFDSAGGPKKLWETVIRVFTGIGSFIADLRQSKSGSLQSGVR